MSAAWHEQSIAAQGEALGRGALSAVDLTRHYLQRIAELDAAGPRLNAVREVNSAAEDIARARDEELRAGRRRGPLHGIPFLVKDNVATGDGMACTAGALALAQFRPARDATIVRRLRAAGAVLLGKCNMTEFADYLSDHMPSEFSSAGGVVRHPHGGRYDRGGGSSIGPACAVAAGLASFAIGSETQNSIQAPASSSGIVGVKPTVGLISRAGLVPLAISQDTAGPMCRSVADAALVLTVLAGVDPEDTLTLSSGAAAAHDYAAVLCRGALAGARIGLPEQWPSGGGNNGASAAELMERVVSRCERAGAIVVRKANIPTMEQVAGLRSSVFPTEFKAGLNAFLRQHKDAAPLASLADILAFNRAHPEQCLRYGQSLAERAEATEGVDAASYRHDRLRDTVLSRKLGIDATLQQYGLDALLVLGSGLAKLTGKAGYPVVTVPAGTLDGQPVGISLIGSAFTEARLIALAHAFHSETQG